MRTDRATNELRPITITRKFTKHAEGSVLVACGDTKVICTVSFMNSVPRFLKNTGKGWLSAEYGLLPRSTHTRSDREAVKGKQNGRTLEIQRLIGRSLRTCVDLNKIGENTLTIDCDVIQADGGTRTAAITGSCVALAEALEHLQQQKVLPTNPFLQLVGAVSVGMKNGELLLDLDYEEDSSADTDMNVIMTYDGNFIEVQGTAERKSFSQKELNQMLDLAEEGIRKIFGKQKEALLKKF